MRMANQYTQLKERYLSFCESRKNLDQKTIKSYRIDLQQYCDYYQANRLDWINKESIEQYIEHMHNKYTPKSVKRKIASLKAFFHYLEIEEFLVINPFHKIQIKYKEPFILPKTIPISNIQSIIEFAYEQYKKSATPYSKKVTLRNILVLELLFATGMRVSELCSLKTKMIDLNDYTIRIMGKGSKERLIQICNTNVRRLIDKYTINLEPEENSYFFVNRLNNRLSEQSVRNMINDYAKKTRITQHITPHMFRHSFATLLLEEDVDIRFIQQMLGHSSITTTQIYTHISIAKQKTILETKHPRNKIQIGI